MIFGSVVTITHITYCMVINFNKLGTVCEHNFLAQVELIIEGYFDLDSNVARPFSNHQTLYKIQHTFASHILLVIKSSCFLLCNTLKNTRPFLGFTTTSFS